MPCHYRISFIAHIIIFRFGTENDFMFPGSLIVKPYLLPSQVICDIGNISTVRWYFDLLIDLILLWPANSIPVFPCQIFVIWIFFPVKCLPFNKKFFQLFTHYVEDSVIYFFIDFCQVDNIRDQCITIFSSEKPPEWLTGINCILVFKVVYILIFPRHDPILYPVLSFIIPAPGNIINKPLKVPVGHIYQGWAWYSVLYLSIIKHFIDYDFSNCRGYLFLEFYMVIFIVQRYLIGYKSAVTPCIITLLIKCYKVDIWLFILGILIIDDEDESFFKCVVEEIFYLLKFLCGIIGSEFSQVTAIFVKITVKILKPVVHPIIIIVLNPVFSECHLMAIIELATSISECKTCKYNDYQIPDIIHYIILHWIMTVSYQQILFQQVLFMRQN